jgi:hypothetical protein
MIKVKVIEDFYFGRYAELKNVVRLHDRGMENYFCKGDTFECEQDIAYYLTKTNEKGRAFIEIIEVIPEKQAEIPEEKPVEEKPKRTRRKKITNID